MPLGGCIVQLLFSPSLPWPAPPAHRMSGCTLTGLRHVYRSPMMFTRLLLEWVPLREMRIPVRMDLRNGILDFSRFGQTPYSIRHVLLEMAVLAVLAILAVFGRKTVNMGHPGDRSGGKSAVEHGEELVAVRFSGFELKTVFLL